jgi:caa(3)-type oxidase subunit IV
MKGAHAHVPILLGLVVLLGMNLGMAYVPLGEGNVIITLGLCLAQMALVFCFFMELRKPEILFRLAACTGLLWLLIYLLLILTDYATRFPGKLLG